MYAYVGSMLRDTAAAEDVTAQAYERAYRKRRTYRRGRGSADAWVFGIARNAALDELRRQKRTAGLRADPHDEAAPAAGPGRHGPLRLPARPAAGRPGRAPRPVAPTRASGLGNPGRSAAQPAGPERARVSGLRQQLKALRASTDYARATVTVDDESGSPGPAGSREGIAGAVQDALASLSGSVEILIRLLGVALPLGIVGAAAWAAATRSGAAGAKPR